MPTCPRAGPNTRTALHPRRTCYSIQWPARTVGPDVRITRIATGHAGDELRDIVVITTGGAVVLARMAAVDQDKPAFSLDSADLVGGSLP